MEPRQTAAVPDVSVIVVDLPSAAGVVGIASCGDRPDDPGLPSASADLRFAKRMCSTGRDCDLRDAENGKTQNMMSELSRVLILDPLSVKNLSRSVGAPDHLFAELLGV